MSTSTKGTGQREARVEQGDQGRISGGAGGTDQSLQAGQLKEIVSQILAFQKYSFLKVIYPKRCLNSKESSPSFPCHKNQGQQNKSEDRELPRCLAFAQKVFMEHMP